MCWVLLIPSPSIHISTSRICITDTMADWVPTLFIIGIVFLLIRWFAGDGTGKFTRLALESPLGGRVNKRQRKPGT